MPTYWDDFCNKFGHSIIAQWSINRTLKEFYEFLKEHGQISGSGTELREALGMLTTLAPDMEMDARNPRGMAQEIINVVKTKIAELQSKPDAPIKFAHARQGMREGFLADEALYLGYRDNISMLLHDRDILRGNPELRNAIAKAILNKIFGD